MARQDTGSVCSRASSKNSELSGVVYWVREKNKPIMNITVYSTPTCPYCKLAKEYLREKGIAFNDIDVSSDPAAANEMVKKSGQMGVPVIDIGGTVIVGWNKASLEEAIEGAKNKKPKAVAA